MANANLKKIVIFISIIFTILFYKGVLAQTSCAPQGAMCGGIAGIQCCSGLTCQVSGFFPSHPDASGTCNGCSDLNFSDTSKALPFGLLNQLYSTTISVKGGCSSYYTFSISSGSLPPGLTLQSQAPATLSGTPTEAGIYYFTITVTDGIKNASLSTQMTIVDTPYIDITYPGYYPPKYMVAFGNSPMPVGGNAYACCSRLPTDITSLTVNGFPITGHIIEYFVPPQPRDPIIGWAAQILLQQPGDNLITAIVKDRYNQTASTSIHAYLISTKIIDPPNGTTITTGPSSQNPNLITVTVTVNSAGQTVVNGNYNYSLGAVAGQLKYDVWLLPGQNIITATTTVDNSMFQFPNGVATDSIVVNYTPPTVTPGPNSDQTPPSVPANFTATPISSTQINLSWATSTDPGSSMSEPTSAAGYKIYRCKGLDCNPSTQIAISTTNSYSDNNLSASTLYVYTVSAYDAAGNNSNQSTSASAITQASPNITPPAISAPSGAIGVIVFTKSLYYGVTNNEVKDLQKFLAQDTSIYPQGLITGFYGPLTTSAVQKFQCKYLQICQGTLQTNGYGLVGPKTRVKLNELIMAK